MCKLSAKSAHAARLMRVLAIRMKVAQTPLILSLLVAGDYNGKSDYASRIFFLAAEGTPCLKTFTKSFNKIFTSAQDYEVKRLPSSKAKKLMSEMQSQRSSIESWLRLTSKDSSTGATGSNAAESKASVPTSKHPQNLSSPFLRASLLGSEVDGMVRDTKQGGNGSCRAISHLHDHPYRRRSYPQPYPNYGRKTLH